jgi:hypothetical protein
VLAAFMQVSELQRRQRRDQEREVRRRERLQEKERAERLVQAKLTMEEEAYQLQVGAVFRRFSCWGTIATWMSKAAAGGARRQAAPHGHTRPDAPARAPPPCRCAPTLALTQVAALAPRIEAMEASWNRLCAISGGSTPEGVVEYWQGESGWLARARAGAACWPARSRDGGGGARPRDSGPGCARRACCAGLQSKEACMRSLVALAEQREAACKAEVSRLLAARGSMYEACAPPAGRCTPAAPPGTSSSGSGSTGAGAEGERGAAAAAATAAAAAAEDCDGAGSGGAEEEEEAAASCEAAAAQIEEAERRRADAQVGGCTGVWDCGLWVRTCACVQRTQPHARRAACALACAAPHTGPLQQGQEHVRGGGAGHARAGAAPQRCLGVPRGGGCGAGCCRCCRRRIC